MRRRRFLRTGVTTGVAVGLAGCASDTDDDASTGSPATTNDSEPADDSEPTTDDESSEEETTEEAESEIDRPANYRWDMRPARNEELRTELGQYVEEPVGDLVEEHPAFEYSTDSDRDDHGVDFEALKLYRDSNFDVLKEDASEPMEPLVEAFVTDGMYEEAKTSGFVAHDTDAPSSYRSEAWLNAETVEDSLDLGHNLIVAIDFAEAHMDGDRPREQAAILREAYKRHHPDFDVLAWTINMGTGSGYDDKISGMMYSPTDDKIRAFSPTSGDLAFATEGNRGMHTEIQDWPILEDGHEYFHPLLFHTDEWNRQNPGFENAKTYALGTIHRIGAPNNGVASQRDRGDFTATTGLTKQLTRTVLEYNSNSASFEDIWNVASAMEYVNSHNGNYVFDTNSESDDYLSVFDGGFAVYEVADESIVDEIWEDQAGEYDNFGQVYDELA